MSHTQFNFRFGRFRLFEVRLVEVVGVSSMPGPQNLFWPPTINSMYDWSPKNAQKLQGMGILAMIVAVVDFKDRSSMSSNCYLNVCEM